MIDQGWSSDEEAIVDVVEEFIREGIVPNEVESEVKNLHNADKSREALDLILEARR
jgi:hypothetical protein